MKIEKLRLKNFAQFEDFELIFNDDITHLVGINGAGKTTVGVTAIWAGFKGIAEKSKTGALIGERFRFITEGKKSLDIEITLYDEHTRKKILLKRHITKSANTIKITPEEGEALDREYVENLFNVSFLSASHFAALTGQQQAAAMGIDVTEHDAKMIAEKETAQGYRRDIKKIGELAPVEECEKKDIDALYLKQKLATEHNAAQQKTHDTWERCTNTTTEIEADMVELENQYREDSKLLQERRANTAREKQELPLIEECKDVGAIQAEIKDIVQANEAYFKYEAYVTSVEELEKLQGLLQENIGKQAKISDERSAYLQSKSFGIKGLQIDNKGNLTKDGKLIRPPYFSKGELEMLVARIGMNLNPELKVRFIDDFELLDDDNQVRLVKNLTKKGFQVITALVGKKITGDKSVLLKSCNITEDPRQDTFDGEVYSNDDDPENGPVLTQDENSITVNHPAVDMENVKPSDNDEDDYF